MLDLSIHIEYLQKINDSLNILRVDTNGYVSVKEFSGYNLAWHDFYNHPISKLEAITSKSSNSAIASGNKNSAENYYADAVAFLTKNPEEQTLFLDGKYSDQLVSDESKDELKHSMRMLALPSIAYAFSLLSQMVHAKSIHELLFVHGTDSALLNAIRVDKSLVSHPLLSQRISEAQISGDSDFFGRLAMEINKPNFLSKVKYPRTYIAYHIFERDGLLVNGKLNPEFGYTYSDLLDALHEAGFFDGQGEGITEPKKLNTHIQTYFKLRTRHPV